MKKLQLTKSQLTAKLDDEDYERLSHFKWSLQRARTVTGGGCRVNYALRRVGTGKQQKGIWLHREVLGFGDGKIDKRRTDHRDGDGLNCTRQNL
jgi:hypothetical protein